MRFENEMIVPGEEMGVGFEASRQRKGKSLSQARVMVFSGLGVLMVLRQRQEDNLIIGFLFSLLPGQSTSNFVWRKAEGKVKLTHLLTSPSLIQDVIKSSCQK